MTAERQNAAEPRPGPHRAQKPHRARLRFDRLPAAYCHPDRIARLLPDGLPAGFRDRLQGSPRLRVRLSVLLARRFALAPLSPDDLSTPEGRFAQLEGEALENALRRIGAIWHAHDIRKIILVEPLRRLIEWLGRDNHRAALGLIDLAPSSDRDDDQPDVDKLKSRIERAGLIAVNAWCRDQPTGLAGRLRLKLPPCPEADDEPPASQRACGLLIVDRVVMTLSAETEGMANADG